MPTEDSDELAMVLELSKSESVQKKLLEEQLMNQEEEDLARALAASMLPNETNPMDGTPESKNVLDTSRTQSSPYHKSSRLLPSVTPPAAESSGLPIPHSDAYPEFGLYEKWRIPKRPEKQVEETPNLEAHDVVRRLSSASSSPYNPPPPRPAAKRPSTASVSSLPRRPSDLAKYSHIDSDKSSSPETSFLGYIAAGNADLSSDFIPPETILEFDNATYARQLATDEEKILKQLTQSLYIDEGLQDQGKSSSTPYGKLNAAQPARTISHEELYKRQFLQGSQASINSLTASTSVSSFGPMVKNPHNPPAADYGFPQLGRANSHQPGNFQENRKSSRQLSPIPYPSSGSHRGSASDTQILHSDRPHLRLDTSPTPDAPRHLHPLPPQPIATTSAPTLSPNRSPPAGTLNVNPFVDHDLLRGVCVFFYYINCLYFLNILRRSYWIQKSIDISATDTDARPDAKYYLASILTMPSITYTSAGLATPAETHGSTE